MAYIRLATRCDREAVREIYLRAFLDGENQIVSIPPVDLLSEETSPDTISMVAESDGALVGHVAFSPVTIESGKNWQGYILAPLGVAPEYQRRGTGSRLVDNGMERLSNAGVNVLFVYGDPKYYGSFGFKADLASEYSPPYELQYPFGWQAIALNECNPERENVSISCVASLSDPELW
jgi:putative acetyltransferase